MDNLASHKGAGVRDATEAVGARLVYRPPYSRDLNPIELAFANSNPLLRSAAERTVGKLQSALGELLERFFQTKCQAYFPHCRDRVR